MNRIINCINCFQKLRVPTHIDHLELTCPSCKTVWEWKSSTAPAADDEATIHSSMQDKVPDFDADLNIAVVGKVSTGKSSLINALMERSRTDPISPVGANSGVTTKITRYKLDNQVFIVDCPGLDDIKEENSQETKKFLSSIDVGIFVITGSADISQKSNYETLVRHVSDGEVFVVLNKIDEWDSLDTEALDEVMTQWKSSLGCSKIYGICSKGYDPKFRKDIPMDLRGIPELRDAILGFLAKKKKDLILMRQMMDKNKQADRLIYSTLATVAGEAFLPGSSAFITATQATAIIGLNYIYTGKTISKKSALTLLPQFIGKSVGTSAFLFIKSFLPPTGIADIAAAGVASSITFAMLKAVQHVLTNNLSLDNMDDLVKAFETFKAKGFDINNIPGIKEKTTPFVR